MFSLIVDLLHPHLLKKLTRQRDNLNDRTFLRHRNLTLKQGNVQLRLTNSEILQSDFKILELNDLSGLNWTVDYRIMVRESRYCISLSIGNIYLPLQDSDQNQIYLKICARRH